MLQVGSCRGLFSALSHPLPEESSPSPELQSSLGVTDSRMEPCGSFPHSPSLSSASLHQTRGCYSFAPRGLYSPNHRHLYHNSERAAASTSSPRPRESSGVPLSLPPINKTTAPQVPAPVSQALLPHEASTGLCAKHPKASPRKPPPPGSPPCYPSTPQKSSLLPASTGPADSDTISLAGRMGVSLACLLPLSLRAEL